MGDHLNDLPMLKNRYARFLAAPANAIDPVKKAVRAQNGYVSDLAQGYGVADALKFYLTSLEAATVSPSQYGEKGPG